MSSIPLGRRLDLVHRIGAAVFGVGLCIFGVLGVINRLEFLAVHGKVLLGLASNGLLSTISLIVGGVLIGAAWRGGRSSSTITVVIGLLFLGSYGRFSGGLSTDNPYYQHRHRVVPTSGARETADRDSADAELAAAELAVAEGHPTPEQEKLVREDAQRRAYEAHLHAWQAYESGRAREENSPIPLHWRGDSYKPWSRGTGRTEENSAD